MKERGLKYKTSWHAQRLRNVFRKQFGITRSSIQHTGEVNMDAGKIEWDDIVEDDEDWYPSYSGADDEESESSSKSDGSNDQDMYDDED